MATGIDDDKNNADGTSADRPTEQQPPLHEQKDDLAASSLHPQMADATRAPSAAGEVRPVSVWTASDARGPLETADDVHALPADDSAVASETEGPTGAPKPSESRPFEPNPSDPIPTQDRPVKRSAWPIAAGIVVGALIGAGSALLADAQGLLGRPAGANDGELAALSAKVDALEKRPDVGADLTKLNGRVTALSDKLAALTTRVESAPLAKPADPVAAQSGAPKSTASQPATGQSTSADVDALKQSVAALQASVETLKSQNSQASNADHGIDEKVATLSSELAGLKSSASQTETSLAGVKDDQKRLSEKVTGPAIAVAADSLVRQVDQGQPFALQLDALASLGVDPAKLAILRQNADRGVPSSKTLAQTFEPLAEPMSATGRKVPAGAGFVDRLKSGMLNLVSIRGVDDTSGTDLPSRVARIKLDLAHDDLADAIATWDALPADAKAKSEAWATLARSSAEAMAAARALQHETIAALGPKKS